MSIAAEPGAADDADDYADGPDGEAPLQVVPADARVVVAERLQRRDLRPLQRERARQRHVEDERRDDQEDEREQEPEALQLRSSFSTVQCESCSARGIAPSPPYGSRRRSSCAMTSSLDAPGDSASATSLKPPSMSKAAASAFASIQKMPKR